MLWTGSRTRATPTRDLDRNYLRHEVLPRIAARFPGYRQTWLRASRNFADLSEIADAQAQTGCGARAPGSGLRVQRLRELSAARAGNLLRWYLLRARELPVPRRRPASKSCCGSSLARALRSPSWIWRRARATGTAVCCGSRRARPARRSWQMRWRGEPELLLPAAGWACCGSSGDRCGPGARTPARASS